MLKYSSYFPYMNTLGCQFPAFPKVVGSSVVFFATTCNTWHHFRADALRLAYNLLHLFLHTNILVGESFISLNPKIRIHIVPINPWQTWACGGTKPLLFKSTRIWGLFVTAAWPSLAETKCAMGAEIDK